MPGIFTSSRVVPGSELAFKVTKRQGLDATRNWEEIVIKGEGVRQTTTSFRTREQTFEEKIEQMRQERSYTTSNRQQQSFSSSHDNGHEFFTVKTEESYSHSYATVRNAQGNPVFMGPLLVPRPQNIIYQLEKMSQNDINFYGGKAIALTAPNKPAANLSTFLGETLLSGLPTSLMDKGFMYNKTRFARNAGSQYLNYAFGWLPFVNDIRSIMKAVIQADIIIGQFERDSGRGVRRRHRFPTINSTPINDVLVGRRSFPHLNSTALYDNSGYDRSIYRTDTLSQNISFSGQYMYHLDVGTTARDKLGQYSSFAKKLMGPGLSPEILWNIAPWSWLADWYANVGDIIANTTRFSDDSLVLRYGYLMRQSSLMQRYTVKDPGFLNGPKGPVSAFALTTQKERYRATPYGFGLDPVAFSPQRWAILIALGMSNTPGRMLG